MTERSPQTQAPAERESRPQERSEQIYPAQQTPASVEGVREVFDRIKSNSEPAETKMAAYRALMKGVDDQESQLASRLSSEQQDLQRARSRLGLVSDGTDSHALRHAQDELATLRSLRESVERELGTRRADQESAEEAARLREGVVAVGDAFEQFANELYRRSQNNIDPFMEPRPFASMRSGITSLRELAGNSTAVDTGLLMSALNTIDSGLEQLKPRSREVREDLTSLGRLINTTRAMHESLVRVIPHLEGQDAASVAADRLKRRSELAYRFMAQRETATRNYLRR